MKKEFKGIVCAGGLGTRLYPLTHVTNKHLLPVYDEPMVHYPLRTLVRAGIKEAIVVTGGPHAGHFIRTLKDGKQLGLDNIHYAYQEREGGIAEAIACAEPYFDGESSLVILGDNCTDANISKEVASFDGGAMIFVKEVPDPERFGVAEVSGKHIVGIEEKPSNPKSNLAVTGLYIYDETVFEKINSLSPSQRGELEVTDLNNMYLREGQLRWAELNGYWRDAGTFETLAEVNQHWREIKGGGAERRG